MSTIKIEIEVDAENKTIKIKDDAGNDRDVQSVLICGGDATSQAFYLFGWGSSADLGWALAHSLRATADPFYKRFFAHFSQWIAEFMGFFDIKTADPKEVLDRWDKEDLEKSIVEKKKWN